MKKLLCLTVVSLLVLPIAARAQGTLKIGTVDMNRTFREYNKTKDAEAKINDAKNQAKKEYDERADAYKKALDDINNLNKQLETPDLNADAKAQKAKERDDKISNIKNMEREITEFRQTRERQLQEQALRMREGIVKEISDVVMDKVKTSNLDLVFDKSGNSLNGSGQYAYPILLWEIVAEIPAPVFPNRERGEPSSFDTIAHRRRTIPPLDRHHAADMLRCHHRADAQVEFRVGSNRARIVPEGAF